MLFYLLLPLFLLSSLGYLLAKTKWISDGWSTGVAQLTAKLLIPALLLNGAYKNGFPAAVSWQVLCAFYLPLLSLFLLLAYAGKPHINNAARALASTYSNTVFVGIPVLLQAVGKDSLQYAFPVILFHSLLAFTLYYLTAQAGARGGHQLLKSLWSSATNPIVISLFLGLALNLCKIALPLSVEQILVMLSSAALPCALLSLGASLIHFHVQRAGESVLVILVKLIVLPALVFCLAWFCFGLPLPVVSVLVILASCPVGVNAYAVVHANGGNATLLSSSVLLTSLGCMLSIPIWLWLLHQVH